MDESENIMLSHEKLLKCVDGKDSYTSTFQEGMDNFLREIRYPPIQDFKSGLEWFNVSEPITFSNHLKGKLVVLDFFTYCCINCMHILPELRKVEDEFSVEDGLVVVGVHSAKFENEKLSSNILAAVQRYNISHPVVNDDNSEMWKNCNVHCWPTLLLLGPYANPIVMLTGEGHLKELLVYIKSALEYYKGLDLISHHKIPMKSAFHLLPNFKGPLLFPGKISNTIDANGQEVLAVSDTGNNRILILNTDGTVIQRIGGNRVGFKDADLENSEFNKPQGLAFFDKDILFVADTENHAIRKVDLLNNRVFTIVGDGVQGFDFKGGNCGQKQQLASPWDLCLYKTMDLDKVGVENAPMKDVLLIAMAGSHQIWALFLSKIIWWKCKTYEAGICVAIAGSGREENRNNQYPHAAAFAQPSGLALSKIKNELFIADSESSSVRRLSLRDGKVTAVVGGDKNPQNLFAFGDKDGSLFDAKLQHALGIALNKNEDLLFVADTYNHKIKKIEVSKNSISTLTFSKIDSTDGIASGFKEPAGLCTSLMEEKLYVTDTNNHCIKVIHFTSDYIVRDITNLDLTFIDNESVDGTKNSEVFQANSIYISTKGGKLILEMKVSFDNGLKITPDAPQKWKVKLPNMNWSCVPNSGKDFKVIDVVINVPPSNDNKGVHTQLVIFEFSFVTCTDSQICLPKNVIVEVPINFTDQSSACCSNTLSIVVDQNRVNIT